MSQPEAGRWLRGGLRVDERMSSNTPWVLTLKWMLFSLVGVERNSSLLEICCLFNFSWGPELVKGWNYRFCFFLLNIV